MNADRQSPEEMLSLLRKEMTLIKAEEMFLKKQILSLDDQFQDLMVSVAERYPDILNEEFAKKPAGLPDFRPRDRDMSSRYKDTLQRMPDKKSRWNEWREERGKRRSFSAGDTNLNEENVASKDGKMARPSSLAVGEWYKEDRDTDRISPESECRTPGGEGTACGIRTGLEAALGDYKVRLLTDSERRKRIRQRLKESRQKLDVVHLGLF